MSATISPVAHTLWTPPHRRLFDFLSDVVWLAIEAVQRWAQRRLETRRAIAQQQVLAYLDDRMRRDLGLGERSVAARSRDFDWG